MSLRERLWMVSRRSAIVGALGSVAAAFVALVPGGRALASPCTSGCSVCDTDEGCGCHFNEVECCGCHGYCFVLQAYPGLRSSCSCLGTMGAGCCRDVRYVCKNPGVANSSWSCSSIAAGAC
jgi:hypothetical protein